MPVRRSMAVALLLVLGAGLVPAAAVHGGVRVQVDQRYEITATLDAASGRLDAELQFELTNRGPSAMRHVDLSVLPRALGFLTMRDSIVVDGEAVRAEWTSDGRRIDHATANLDEFEPLVGHLIGIFLDVSH